MSATRRFALFAIASLAALSLLSGCSASSNSIALNSYARIAGNWQFSSQAPTAAALPALAGSLNVNGSQVSGTLHPLVASSCAPSSAFPVNGTIDEKSSNVTLTSSGFTGGSLTLTGTLSLSQTSLTNAAYTITGGTCAMPSSAATAAQYTAITGTYAGTMHSASGTSLPVTTVFTQTTQPDSNGTYHLQGQATFGATQTCLLNPDISDSTVTGSTLSATYSQPQGTSATSVTVNGTFNTDASLLTLSSYAITGGNCDGDTGSGTLTRQ